MRRADTTDAPRKYRIACAILNRTQLSNPILTRLRSNILFNRNSIAVAGAVRAGGTRARGVAMKGHGVDREPLARQRK